MCEYPGTRALIAMSGGVDSAMAAYLLQKAGCDCTGVTMRLYRDESGHSACTKSCCSDADEDDAAYVCYQLGIPHESVCYSRLFEEKVIGDFVREYERGRTPNPCIACNRFLKFDALLRHALDEGYDLLATGHYARIEREEGTGRWQLFKAADPDKDQSYVLSMLRQEQLAHLRFPLGTLYKSQVRALAAEAGLVNAAKRDSQDICFIPDGDYVAFLEQYTGHSYPAGDILDEQGQVVGRHRGAIRCTIGQRRGLNLAAGARVYVTAKDMARNTITCGAEAALYSRALTASDFNWLSVPEPAGPLRVSARTRYHQTESPALVRALGEDRIELVFDTPQRAVTPGQTVVLYDGDMVLGGGIIDQTEK